MRKILIVVVIGLLLAGLTWSAAQHEALRSNGREVLLALTPVDPRALLMGDYMALDFDLNRDVDRALADKYGKADSPFHRRGQELVHYANASWPSQGLAVVRLADGTTQAQKAEMNGAPLPAGTLAFVRLDDGSPLAAGEYYLLYRVRWQRAHVAARAFYFQEGYAKDYEKARYGLLRLGADGRQLLMNLTDDEGKPIQPLRKAK